MLPLPTDIPPTPAVVVTAAITVTPSICRIVVACWLGLTAIRTAPPEDAAKALAAVKRLLEVAFRFRR